MFNSETGEVSQVTDKVALWLDKVAQNLFVITMGLSPLLFIPSTLVPIGYSKVLLVLLGVVAALVFQSLAILRSGTITLRLPLPLLALVAVVCVMLTSALLSGDIRDSLVGNTFGIQTVSFVALLLLITVSGLMLKNSKTAILRFYLLFLVSSIILGLFHVFRFVVGAETLSLGIFTGTTSTPLGGWNDLALYFGAVLLMSLVAIEHLPLNKIARICLAIVVILSLVVLAVVNFVFVWVILGIVSLVVLMYSLTKHRFAGNQLSFDEAQTGPVTSIILSTVVFVASALFVIGGSTFGPIISNATGVNYMEVRPSVTATFDVARQALDESAILGIGPNKFIDAWRLYKDQSINETIFWNTNFEAGNGYLTTSLVTGGVIGFFAWILFLLLLIWSGMRLLFRNSLRDIFWSFVAVSSFVTAIYLWGMSVVYVPSAATLILAATLTGIFLASYVAMTPGNEWTLSVMNNRSFGFILILASMLIIFGSIGSLYFVSQHYLALHKFNQTLNSVEPGDNIDEIMTAIAESYQLSANDSFAIQLANYNLSQINVLLNSESSDEAAELFQNAAANGINAAQTAIDSDRSEPLNWVVLGQIYSALTAAGVEGAYDRANESFAEAQKLDPLNPSVVLLSAQAAARGSDSDRSRQLAEQAIGMKSNYVDAFLFLTELDIAEGNVEDAIRRTKSVISLEPNNPARRYQLGILQSANQNTVEAVAAFENAIALDTNFSNARYFLALSYAELGRPEDARVQLEKVLELNPGNELVIELINQLNETGTIVTDIGTSTVEDSEVSVSDTGQVTSTENPNTPLVTTVNGSVEEPTSNDEDNSSNNDTTSGTLE